jgi:hypothetical protein
MLKHLLFFLAVFLSSGCAQEKLKEDELKKYLMNPEHGTVKESDDGTVKTKVIYRPSDLLVVQQLKGVVGISKDSLKNIKKNFDGFLYFILSLSSNNGEVILNDMADEQLYAKRINHFSFEMKKHVYLITSEKDTIPAADFNYPRMFGSTKSTSMLFSFNNENIRKSTFIDFCYYDIDIKVKFRFLTTDLKNVPNLKFN